MSRGFGVNRTIIENGQAILSFNRKGLIGLSQGRRDEMSRKTVSKDNAAAKQGSKGSQGLATEKATAGEG
jgi:hypothetical protein